MNLDEAIEFLRPAMPAASGVWADLGAGSGTFTEALAVMLGANGTVVAVDDDARAVRSLERLRDRREHGRAAIVVARGDFAELDEIAELADVSLDGALLANALHFVDHPEHVLQRVAHCIRPGARIVVIEYDRTSSNRWVPFPLPSDRLLEVTGLVGLTPAEVVGRRPSRYHREMYCAVALRPLLPPRGRSP